MKTIDQALPETSHVIRSGMERGLQSGLQLYVSFGGEVIADCGFGESAPGMEMTADSIMLWLSAGKPLTAVAIMQLVERDLLELDAKVSEWIPEFAAGGKEPVCLQHLLTHTGGFRNVDSGWPHRSWNDTISRICESSLEDEWKIGESAGYHPSSSWYILGELIQRVDPLKRSFSQYIREEVCLPIGMSSTWNGMPASVWSENVSRIGQMSQLEKGTVTVLPWHDETHCRAVSPGVNSRGPVRELGRFYNCLINGGQLDGQRILSEDSVSQMTSRHREELFDQTLFHQVDFGLGVLLDSNRYGVDTVPYGFGPYCSEQTFGHGGAQSSIGFADPVQKLVVCYVANCRIGEPRHQKRNREIVTAIYRDLGLHGN